MPDEKFAGAFAAGALRATDMGSRRTYGPGAEIWDDADICMEETLIARVPKVGGLVLAILPLDHYSRLKPVIARAGCQSYLCLSRDDFHRFASDIAPAYKGRPVAHLKLKTPNGRFLSDEVPDTVLDPAKAGLPGWVLDPQVIDPDSMAMDAVTVSDFSIRLDQPSDARQERLVEGLLRGNGSSAHLAEHIASLDCVYIGDPKIEATPYRWQSQVDVAAKSLFRMTRPPCPLRAFLDRAVEVFGRVKAEKRWDDDTTLLTCAEVVLAYLAPRVLGGRSLWLDGVQEPLELVPASPLAGGTRLPALGV